MSVLKSIYMIQVSLPLSPHASVHHVYGNIFLKVEPRKYTRGMKKNTKNEKNLKDLTLYTK